MSRTPRSAPGARVALSVAAWLWALGLSSSGSVSVASAAPTAESPPLDVALRYEASAECPDREVFSDLVRVRAPHVRLLNLDPAPELEVVVVLGEHPSGAAGQARILLDGRVRDSREFLGASCLEVARAAAISVSFVLESWSVTAPAEDPQRRAAPPERAVDEGTKTSEPPPVSAPSPEPASGAAEPSPAVRFDVGLAPVAASLLDKPWLWGAGLSLGARSAYGPRPSARLNFLALVSAQPDSAAASYRWFAGEALLCAFRLGDAWSLSPCAHGFLGVLHAEGGAIEFPADVAVPWLAVGPSLKGSLAIGSSVRLVASVSASVPLAQRSFVFERPRRLVTQTRGVGWLVSAGVEHDIGGS